MADLNNMELSTGDWVTGAVGGGRVGLDMVHTSPQGSSRGLPKDPQCLVAELGPPLASLLFSLNKLWNEWKTPAPEPPASYCAPPNSRVEPLSPNTYRCDCVWPLRRDSVEVNPPN